jgi:predicted ATPase
MLARLGRRFELLVTHNERIDPRHRSLRATLDWSYQLLSPPLQRFFARLSIFRGGWTLEAAEAVCAEPLALEYLSQLRECSMVQTVEDEIGMRYRLLQTLQEYGAEQLLPEERLSLQHQHAAYYLSLAEEAEPQLMGGGARSVAETVGSGI